MNRLVVAARARWQTPCKPKRQKCADRLDRMRRWLCIFLLALLPLQSALAAAATYCNHASGAHPSHFGHHQGHHHAASGNDSDSDSGTTQDNDATHCHGICVAMIASAVEMSLTSAGPPSTPCTSAEIQAPSLSPPERPQWMGHA